MPPRSRSVSISETTRAVSWSFSKSLCPPFLMTFISLLHRSRLWRGESEDPEFVVDVAQAAPVEQFATRLILLADLVGRQPEHLVLDLARDDHDAIEVGEDQLAGMDE